MVSINNVDWKSAPITEAQAIAASKLVAQVAAQNAADRPTVFDEDALSGAVVEPAPSTGRSFLGGLIKITK